MTATIATNVVLSKDGLIVTLATEPTDEENLTKGLKFITPPKSTGKQETDPDSADYGANPTKILDILMKAEQRITVDGFLSTGIGTSDTHDAAQDKKSDLKKIFLGGGVMSMIYEGSTFDVNMDKLSIKRIATDGQAANTGEAEFSVKFTAIRGEDL